VNIQNDTHVEGRAMPIAAGTAPLDRSHFRRTWGPIAAFLALETLVTFWTVARPHSHAGQALGTMSAATALALVSILFLHREGVRVADISLGARAWRLSLACFAGWLLAVTLLDGALRLVMAVLHHPLQPLGGTATGWLALLDVARYWIFVGFAEEIAFRGYLQNRLIATLGHRWRGVLLAALIFGVWHIPSLLTQGVGIPDALLGIIPVTLLSLVYFNAGYEWAGLLPLVALFHGWNDDKMLPLLGTPTFFGALLGYALMLVLLIALGRRANVRSPESGLADGARLTSTRAQGSGPRRRVTI
jgi:membrane protease YdiL (CAAX protease family)